MADDAPDAGSPGAASQPRYCQVCGEVFAEGGRFCPTCGTRWQPPIPNDVRSLATLLTELALIHQQGRLSDDAYTALRAEYEARLSAVRTATPAPAQPAAPVSEMHRTQWRSPRRGLLERVLDPGGAESGTATAPTTAPVEPPIPPKPPKPPGPTLSEWASARQADILLYLGAFVLSIAALIFVGYQGDALSGPGRFAVLVLYTAGFLVLGVLLPRWDRVKEAGPVFLALGAVLVPVNFVALRLQVLDQGELSNAWLWLAGAGGCAALYFLLAARGYGRLYAVPGALAAVVAWGALAAVLTLSPRWLAPWYMGATAALTVAADLRRPTWSLWVERGALVIGVGALLFTHLAALFEEADESRANAFQLPLTYALLTLGLIAHQRLRRTLLSLALLPAAVAMTALSGWWAILGLEPAWFGPFIAAAGLGYLVIAATDAPARAERWAIGAALAGALALYVAYAGVLGDEDQRWALPVTLALLLAGAGAAHARLRWWQPLAALPLLGAALGAATLWAGWDLSRSWGSPWLAGAALAYLAIAEYDGTRSRSWRIAAGVVALLALLAAHGDAADGGVRAALPLAYGIVLVGAAWDTWRRQDAGALALPALAALGADSVLWAAGVQEAWWAYPALAAAGLILLTEPWWRSRPVLAENGWPYLLTIAAAVPLAFIPLYEDAPEHGTVAFAVAALLLLVAALRMHGALARLVRPVPGAHALLVERQIVSRVGGLYLYAAAGYLNAVLGVTGVDRAWVFAGIGAAEWLGLAVAGRRVPGLFGSLAPGGTILMALAASLAADEPGMSALLLVAGAALPALAFAGVRRWSLWPVAAAFGVAALEMGWRWRDLDLSNLTLSEVALAALLTAALTRRRDYARDERGVSVTLLSWLPWAWALLAAYVRMGDREATLVIDEAITRTREWAVLAVAVAAAGAAVLLEGLRLRKRDITVIGSAGMLAALLMTIAITQPENVQAYTVPVALYLVGLGFLFRRSRPLFGEQMYVHEAVMVLGVLVLVLPPAQQSFQPNGTRYGLELIAIGLALLGTGIVLSARWLVAGGVLALSGVAVRWLTNDSNVPYWLTLGIVGMLLLGVGLLLLLERDRWDRTRARLARWWSESAAQPPPLG